MVSEHLVAIAEALDGGKSNDALGLCEAVAFAYPFDMHQRKTFCSLYMKACQSSAKATSRAWFEEISTRVVDGHQENQEWFYFEWLSRAPSSQDRSMGLSFLAHAIWPSLHACKYFLQINIIEGLFQSNLYRKTYEVWELLLAKDKSFLPDYWVFQTLFLTFGKLSDQTAAAEIDWLLERTKRLDLSRFLHLFHLLMEQRETSRALTEACGISDPVMRQRLAYFISGQSFTSDVMHQAYVTFTELSDVLDDKKHEPVKALMEARIQAFWQGWNEAFEIADDHTNDHLNGYSFQAIRALSLVHKNEVERALENLEHTKNAAARPWYLSNRLAGIGVEALLRRQGRPSIVELACPTYRCQVGRPLAQSFWHGPELRWIEQLALKSYVLNGWRFQLYTYDDVANVPDGVELCDAASILPRSTLFRETQQSGLHKGSLGAFSDYFRYALLHRRGGMWTDTDVINFELFEPETQRFIATEKTDAIFAGVNGAMMAAPAGDTLQRLALEYAERAIHSGDIQFAKIGPQLLGELLLLTDDKTYEILPPWFLNPITWMETGSLKSPFTEVVKRFDSKTLKNIHVYTETWRTFALGLGKPPEDDGFLSILFDRVMNEDKSAKGKMKRILKA